MLATFFHSRTRSQTGVAPAPTPTPPPSVPVSGSPSLVPLTLGSRVRKESWAANAEIESAIERDLLVAEMKSDKHALQSPKHSPPAESVMDHVESTTVKIDSKNDSEHSQAWTPASSQSTLETSHSALSLLMASSADSPNSHRSFSSSRTATPLLSHRSLSVLQSPSICTRSVIHAKRLPLRNADSSNDSTPPVPLPGSPCTVTAARRLHGLRAMSYRQRSDECDEDTDTDIVVHSDSPDTLFDGLTLNTGSGMKSPDAATRRHSDSGCTSPSHVITTIKPNKRLSWHPSSTSSPSSESVDASNMSEQIQGQRHRNSATQQLLLAHANPNRFSFPHPNAHTETNTGTQTDCQRESDIHSHSVIHNESHQLLFINPQRRNGAKQLIQSASQLQRAAAGRSQASSPALAQPQSLLPTWSAPPKSRFLIRSSTTSATGTGTGTLTGTSDPVSVGTSTPSPSHPSSVKSKPIRVLGMSAGQIGRVKSEKRLGMTEFELTHTEPVPLQAHTQPHTAGQSLPPLAMPDVDDDDELESVLVSHTAARSVHVHTLPHSPTSLSPPNSMLHCTSTLSASLNGRALSAAIAELLDGDRHITEPTLTAADEPERL